MRDPTTRTVVGRSGLDRRATCTSQMGCFETVIAPLLRSQPSFEEQLEHCQEGQTGPIVARPRPRPTHGCLNLSKPTTSVLAGRRRTRKNLHRPRSCGSGRRHIHRTVDGAIHDASVRQTIWRHRYADKGSAVTQGSGSSCGRVRPPEQPGVISTLHTG